MGILTAIWRLISKIFSAVLGWLGDLFGKFFWIILILVVIWYAPVIVAWLTSVGAPGFVVSAFETIALATPYVQSAGMWLWNGASSLVSSAWSAYRGLDAGTQASIALGAAALIAPEETAAVISDASDLLVDAVGVVGGALLSSPWVLAAGAVALYFLFFRKQKSDVVVSVAPSSTSDKVNKPPSDEAIVY